MSKKTYIRFSYNWNGKLACQAFTTIRPASALYETGERYQIFLKDEHLFDAVIIEKRRFPVSKINDFVAYLDTGYNAEECKKIINRMYKGKVTEVDFILLRRVEKKREQ